MDLARFKKILDSSHVGFFPRHRLSTFGTSEIQYSLVSPLSDAPPRAQLRTGRVTAEKPKIITPQALAKRFEGFGPEAENFERMLEDFYGEPFRGLAYTFRNRLDETSLRRQDARELSKNIRKDLENRSAARSAVIFGPDKGWQFSLMKFILEETARSFPSNFQELRDRGFFDPAQKSRQQQRREIESLFAAAAQDPSKIRGLGEFLKTAKVFEEYQDRFFQLVKGG